MLADVVNVKAVDAEHAHLSLSAFVDLDHVELLILSGGYAPKEEVFLLPVLGGRLPPSLTPAAVYIVEIYQATVSLVSGSG